MFSIFVVLYHPTLFVVFTHHKGSDFAKSLDAAAIMEKDARAIRTILFAIYFNNQNLVATD
jgi:hypothetical protein